MIQSRARRLFAAFVVTTGLACSSSAPKAPGGTNDADVVDGPSSSMKRADGPSASGRMDGPSPAPSGDVDAVGPMDTGAGTVPDAIRGGDHSASADGDSTVTGDAAAKADAAPKTDASIPDYGNVNPIPQNAKPEEVKSGFMFLEGPVWNVSAGELLFSDIPKNTIWRFKPPSSFTVFRMPSDSANGLALGPDGALIACEHGTRRVSRSVGNAKPTTVVDRWPGGDGTKAGRLNSPNDAAVHRNGTIYFTDPDYGVMADQRELLFWGVYRVDPQGKIWLVSKDFNRPNGIALSADQSILYVTNTDPPSLRKIPVDGDGSTGAAADFAKLVDHSDGITVDIAGNVYATVKGAVQIFRPDGKEWGKILLPKTPANCAFGDSDLKTLYMTARETLYRIRLNIPGLPNTP